jgi:hypothetical protein
MAAIDGGTFPSAPVCLVILFQTFFLQETYMVPTATYQYIHSQIIVVKKISLIYI